jgi:hypothetical protein
MNHRGRAVHAGPIRVATGLLVAGLWLASAARAEGQTAEGTIPFDGTQVFRHYVLHDLFKLTPLRNLGELSDRPKDTVLIVFGETAVLEKVRRVTGGLTRFQKQGGALLIASDRTDNGALGEWGLVIDGRLVHEKEERAYRGLKECPLVTRFSDPGHPLFRGLVRGIATNQPSFVRPWHGGLLYRAAFSADCRLQRRVRAKLPPGAVFLVGGARDFGPDERMVVMAGHGVFMNGMIAQRDNDNFAFACNCIRWLTDGGKRKHVLFLEEGTVQAELNVPLRALPPPPLPSSRVVNKLLRGLEEERFFDRLLLRIVPRDKLLSALVLLFSAGLLVYGVSLLLRARHQGEAAVPLVTATALAATDANLPLMIQRDRDVVRSGNLWEAARTLARSCFDQAGAASPGHPARVPPLEIAGGWLQRRRLARQVRYLWQLAYSAAPVPVSPRQFVRMAGLVRAVRSALASGTLRFHEAATARGERR